MKKRIIALVLGWFFASMLDTATLFCVFAFGIGLGWVLAHLL